MAQKFLIGYVGNDSGLQTDLKPWLLPDNAFSSLNNAYVFRGRVRKRFGSTSMGADVLSSRLRMDLGNTGASAHTATLPAGANQLAVGQQFSIGSDIFTVTSVGGVAIPLLSTNGAVTATLNDTVNPNTVTFTGAGVGVAVYWYPSLPVMGIQQYETQPINDEPTIAFDTKFAYQFDPVNDGWERLSTGTDTWTGSNSQFFWSITYQGATPDLNYFWTTNYTTDGIRYWTGSTWATPVLTYAAPSPGVNTIITSRIIVQFKNRLVLLNTIENVNGLATTFVNRCRYSAVGSPLAANAWRQDIPGNGSAIDAPTQEAIVTAQSLKDRLIVYFERSTYELVYTGNEVFPFVWQKINTELGAESTFSQVPFDQAVLGFGQTGIHACSGANVQRIDNKIPQLVFNLHNTNAGVERVAGIRSYFPELVYWTYPSESRDGDFPWPNRVLVYNYANNSWAINDDSYTTFGYFQLGENSPGLYWDSTLLWGTIVSPWKTKVLRERVICAGNQEGFVNLVRENETRNAPSLQITNILITGAGLLTLIIVNHNLLQGDFILLENLNGITITDVNSAALTSVICQVISDPFGSGTPDTVDVQALDGDGNPITFTFTTPPPLGYKGGGTASLVSVIDINTKEYNFFTGADRNCYVPRVDFYVDRTTNGEISVDYFISSASLDIVDEGSITGALLGTSVLETSPYALVPLESQQARLWHPLYFQAEGENIAFRFHYTDSQMFKYDYNFTTNTYIYQCLEDFQLNAMIIHAEATASRLQ